ncbi:type I phosphomannose isomerase catalytic subunit [Ruminococcus flavefaciens]|uniref:Phosphohexomutase n=1 Tax=Ruminococcus flavefaciens TaxID=1265 RepID=A0A315XWF3_RUMFL|nr:type I phosphomannose isomerase catalytic subunit [Ruminococcus flavefaciens]MBQ6168625.1 class I mannose-6-phosphate isomerase [Ruminococcus sp.]PWJ11255.1 mannose-6-phosphate isomerase [Ruminococcus flavefaciens]SSA50817.1 mannose-6-phosphate isomerase [Ruminococcus flavefaciens]
MRPFYLKAPVKDYIWGGTRLRELFGKEGGDRLAESWELSCHPDGECYIMGGEFDGMKLSDFVNEHPEAVGSGFKSGDSFPVLVKLIDAKNDLSVQVHPNDEYAHKYENDNGKTEMWYVIDAAPDSELIYGFNEELSKEDFRKAIENNTLMEKLRRVPVKQGDVFFIEPGTLHAIGKGILIAEIQQSSNVTYRVYDYGRLGADGKPRPLHIEKALEVTNTKPLDPERPVYGLELDGVVTQLLADCQYFNVNRHRLIKELELYADKNSFAHVLMIGGSGGELVADNHRLELTMGSSVFVPAGTGAFAIKGNCDVIVTTIQ